MTVNAQPPVGQRARRTARGLRAVLVAAVAITATAGVASAHVAVNSPDAVRGGELALVSFRVPTESDPASTVTLAITLPTSTKVAEVMVQPLPGGAQTVANRTHRLHEGGGLHPHDRRVRRRPCPPVPGSSLGLPRPAQAARCCGTSGVSVGVDVTAFDKA